MHGVVGVILVERTQSFMVRKNRSILALIYQVYKNTAQILGPLTSSRLIK